MDAAGAAIMGAEYARTHQGLGRLAKIYDFGARIPYHIHQMKEDAALLGHNSKEEAYYFPENLDVGPHPETFFGVHPYIVEQKKTDVLLPYLVDWKDDLILRHSRAYLLVPGEGFHLPSGVLHAPGTAVTIELQEDSDVFSMLQALVAGKIISKDLLFKDVHPNRRAQRWRACGLGSDRLGDQWRSVLLRESPYPARPGQGDATGRRRGVLDLLQHDQVQRQEAAGQAGSDLHQR